MAISTDILRRIMEIRREECPPERIQERRRYEDAAIAIIDNNFDRLSAKQVERLIEFMNGDFRGGRHLRDRFGSQFGADVPNNSEDALNELFIEVYWKENIDIVDDLMKMKRVKGAGECFISCLLYLKDRDRYNIMNEKTIKGIELIFNEKISGRTFRERYGRFNELANKLRQICKLEPQEVDVILWRITRP